MKTRSQVANKANRDEYFQCCSGFTVGFEISRTLDRACDVAGRDVERLEPATEMQRTGAKVINKSKDPSSHGG